MFKNKQVHDALIKLLKGGVKDERFVTDSKEFGIDWITHTVTSNNVKTELKELVSETFTQEKRVINTSCDLLKFFVLHPDTKELTKDIFSRALLQSQVLSVIAQQMEAACLIGV